MRLRYLFFAMVVCLGGKALPQSVEKGPISRSFNASPLIDVIKFLEDASNQKFSYSSSALPLDQPTTISFSDNTLTQALDKLAEVVPLQYKMVNGKVVLMYSTLKQTIRGSVRDQATQSPVIGATVTVLGITPVLGSATDMDGNFRIPEVPLGRRDLKVSYVGYEDFILPNILIGSGKEAVVVIDITESVTQMQELIVTDEGTATLPVNGMAQISARSFTVEETKRFPVGVGDPLRLASSFAGVVSTDDVNNEIVIRGNTPRGILWKLDGVEIPSPNHFSSEGTSSGGISMFSTQVISRSDFFTGAFAPEYGNATAGVFDIHLRNGNNEAQESTVQAGLLGLDVSAEGPMGLGKSSYLFNYRYSTLAMLDGLGLELLDENEKTSFQDLSFKFNFPTKSLGTFSLFGLGGKSSVTEDFLQESGEEVYDMGVVGLSNQFYTDPKMFVRTTLSVSGTNIKNNFMRIGDAEFIEIQDFRKTYKRGTILINRKFNARHVLESGFTYSKLEYNFLNHVRNSLNQPPFDNYVKFNDLGQSGSKQSYLSWKYRMSNQLSMVAGMHWLHFDLTGESAFEPRGSLRWQMEEDKALTLGYGKHSRIESLEFYFGNFIANNGAILNYNRNLGLTKSDHYVMGYEKNFNENAYFRTEIYYQHLYNVPVFLDSLQNAFSTLNLSDGYASQPLVNSGTGKNYGIELTLERKFANSYYYLMNVSVYESKYRARDRVQRDTRFNGNAASNFLFGKEFNVGRNGKNNILGISTKFAYAGNKRYTPISLQASRQLGAEIRPLINAFKLKYADHSRFDLQISFRRNTKRTTSEWRLDVQNLFNKKNVLYDFYSVPGQAVGEETSVGIIPILSYRLEF